MQLYFYNRIVIIELFQSSYVQSGERELLVVTIDTQTNATCSEVLTFVQCPLDNLNTCYESQIEKEDTDVC